MTNEFPIEMTMRKQRVFIRIERACYGIDKGISSKKVFWALGLVRI